ncbi:MAG: T9SS type A sorting domain-containing protein [Winogradskyella sp.]|nr:T9SS type A sorting domain-containing protein [Winogradskyella sp.]
MKFYLRLFLSICPFLLVAQTQFTASITPDLSAYGETTSYPGLGEYAIFNSADEVFDKPIIMVDGFDPGDTRTIEGLYDLLNYEGSTGILNLADLVLADGYDLVVLNFPVYTRIEDGLSVDGGADFMERNAMLLVDLLNIVNATKTGNEQNIIIGPSMGGIISRYALNYMEANNLEHDTRLWISFDAPHHGANVPIGLQHQLNYLAFSPDINAIELQPLINGLLKSSAARQLLVDHFEAHLLAGSDIEFDPLKTLPEPHPYRTLFQSNINSFNTSGFPENVRKISIINGSGEGRPYNAIGITGPVVIPGYPVVDVFFPSIAPFTTADLKVNLTPASASGISLVSSIEVIAFGVIEVINTSASSDAYSYSDGIDAAPGGLFYISGFNDTIEPGSDLATDFLNALQIDKFNFIPSVSALALEITNDEIDWYHTIDLDDRATTNNTPFDATFLPIDNESHVLLTENNVAFALNEIYAPQLSVLDIDATDILLAKNPIKDELILQSNFKDSIELTVYDLLGHSVFNSSLILDGVTTIPLDLPSGIYILKCSSVEGRQQTFKIVVN